MARPSYLVLASNIAAWDADIDANFGLIFDAPFPMYQVDTAAELPSASSYDQCLAMVADDLYISDGTDWSVYLTPSVNVIDSTATTAEDMATDFNTLLAALQTAGIMETS